MATTTKMATMTDSNQAEAGFDVGTELERVDREVRAFVNERPVLALLSAIAAGYLVGRLLRRRG